MRRVALPCLGLILTLFLSTTAPAAPLARYFPKKDLVAYAEFDGLDAHAEQWRKTAAYKVLNETTTGAMLDDLARQLVGRTFTLAPGERAETLKQVRALARGAVGSGFAVGVVRSPDGARVACVGLVLRGAGQGEVRAFVEKFMEMNRGADAKAMVVEKPGGRKVNVEVGSSLSDGLAWWREGDDLVLSLGAVDGADLMIDAFDGRTPDAATHPARVELARVENGFTPVGFAFVEQAALKELSAQYAAYGLDQITRVDYRWGFHGDALMTVTRAAAPAPRSGLLALFDQPTFDRATLPPLPPGLGGFTAFSVDAAGLYDRLSSGFANTDPATHARFEAFEKSFRDRTGQRLRDDVLTHLGPRVTYYTLPRRADAPANVLAGLAQGLFANPASAAVIEVKEADRFGEILDEAMTKARDSFKAEALEGRPRVRIRPLEGAGRGYVVSISPTTIPLPAGMKLTLILGKSSLVIASDPEAARKVVALESRGGALPAADDLAGSVGRLPDGMIFARVSDERRSFLPELIANLPGLIRWYAATPQLQMRMLVMQRGMAMPARSQPVLVEIDPDLVPSPDAIRPLLYPSESSLTADAEGFRLTTRDAFPAFNPAAVAPVAAVMLVPAYQARRAAETRMRSVNNLKQIGLAFHNHHSIHNQFPPAATLGKNGKPLLSWRVAILPLMEQQALYNEFKLDEPWDSPHNKPLLARMPAVYAVPNSKAAPGMTFYRGFSGESTLFDPKVKQGVGIQTVTDGTSNTIGVVEARTAVPWTKPGEEIAFDPAAPPDKIQALLKELGGHSPGGFNALFLDGSVKFIKQSINVVVLKALITRSGGEVVSSDSY